MLTEKQAWRKIGIAFLKEPEERSEVERKIAKYGLCSATWRLRNNGIILRYLHIIMLEIIDSFPMGYEEDEDNEYGFFDNYHARANQIARGDFCMLLSYMTDAEREELRK